MNQNLTPGVHLLKKLGPVLRVLSDSLLEKEVGTISKTNPEKNWHSSSKRKINGKVERQHRVDRNEDFGVLN